MTKILYSLYLVLLPLIFFFFCETERPSNECSFKFSLFKKAKLVRGAYGPQGDTYVKLIIIFSHPACEGTPYSKQKVGQSMLNISKCD